MALLEMVAECEIYFTTNWTATSIQIEDKDFDYTGKDTWISLYFVPVLNARIGFDGTTTGRIRGDGLQSVYCYHKKQKLALKLADDVKTFFNGVTLPKDIHIDIGIDGSATALSNGFYEVKVNFSVTQFS
jgi:hypothetical protein